MTRYEIRFSKEAKKDVKRLSPKLRAKLKTILLEVITEDPFAGKKLLGDLAGNYSYRLTYKDRIVYSIDEAAGIVYVKRARTHYGE